MVSLINLENNQYTQEYVSTDYGYTIVFRGDQKEKLSLEEEKQNIITALSEELEVNDENIYYKALINMRKENGLEFQDTDLKSKYDTYCNQYN